MERLCAKGPVLVWFFEASVASSFRSLDWIRGWHERYAPHGLAVVGIHTPRSAFASSTDDLATICERFGIGFPVASDADRLAWREYGCGGWPSLFLWRRGGALSWVHFGEGEYQATEHAIREQLGEGLPAAAVASRRSDAEGARVLPPSEEVFPGGAHEVPLEGGAGDAIELEYEAGAAYLAVSGSGTVGGSIDGAALDPIEVEGPVMIALAEHGKHGAHRLTLAPGLGTRVWSVGFGAGVP